MGFIASFFAGLKTEVEWLITSLAVATGNSDSLTDTQTADAAAPAHRDDAAPAKDSTIPSIVDQQADSVTAGHQIAQDHAQNSGSDSQLAETPIHNPANLLINADFLVDTTGHSSPAMSPGLTPISFEPGISGLSGISAIVGAPPDQDFHVTLPENDTHTGTAVPHPDAGEYALTSLGPHLFGEFSHGNGGGGSGSGGTAPSPYISNNGAHVTAVGSTGFNLTLNFDSSVAKAPSGFITDIEKVADFFTGHYTNNANVTIKVGFGEVGGSHLGGGALGESESWYTDTGNSNTAFQYSDLYNAYNTLFGSANPAVKIPAADPFAGNDQYWITTASAQALGFGITPTTDGSDGSVGFSSSSGIFSYSAGSVGPKQYDFFGVAAHEISEVLGRATLNGAKDFGGGYGDYSTLDLFHFADGGSGRISSGTTAGYFSLDGSTDATEGHKEFNTSPFGDLSDWAISSPSDAFDWAGGQGTPSAVSYADFLVMEAAGWVANSSLLGLASWDGA